MEIEPLRRGDVVRFVDDLWVPSQREMAATTEYTLADDVRRHGLVHRRARLPEADCVTYLARRGDEFLGYATVEVKTPAPLFRQERECHVNELYVREEARRGGLASALFDAVGEWAREHDCARLDLNVDAGNRAARALDEKRGYEVQRYNVKKRVGQE
jgi:GNAT superfamily N-acetyltransferase